MLVNQGRVDSLHGSEEAAGRGPNGIPLQGMTAVQAYDGTEGLKISPSADGKILRK